MDSHRKPFVRIILLFLAGMLLVGIFLAAQRGAAGVTGYLLQQHLDAWEKSPEPPSLNAWEKGDRLFKFTRRFTPDDPDLHQQAGRLYEWRAEMARDDPAERTRHLEQAISQFRSAIRQRPAWPYAWTDLAHAKVRAGQLNGEYRHAFRQALQLGPWEEKIQLDMARLGFITWDELDKDSRQLLMENIRNTAKYQARKLMRIAEEQDRLVLACFAVKDNEYVDGVCRKKGIK